MGLHKTIFPNKIGHGTTLGRLFRRFRVLIQKIWGPGWQIYHSFFEWIGLYTHFCKKTLKNQKTQHPSKFWENKIMFSKRYKDQNDRIGKIYRFETSFDHSSLKQHQKQMDWEKNGFPSCVLISESAWSLYTLCVLCLKLEAVGASNSQEALCLPSSSWRVGI